MPHIVHSKYGLSNRQSWSTLQELIALRSKNLEGAYEIHKFNNDARELLARIQVSRGVNVYALSLYILYMSGKRELY